MEQAVAPLDATEYPAGRREHAPAITGLLTPAIL
jgi:hypothetical protein